MKVPVYEPQETIRPLGQVADRGGAPAAAFGAGIGEALRDVSSTLARVGLIERRKADQTAVTSAETKLSSWTNDRLFNPEIGAFSVQGKKAFGLSGVVMPEYDRQVSELTSSLSNDEQRSAFAQMAASRRVAINQKLNEHEYHQREQYYDDESESALQNSVRSAGNFFNDPAQIAFELSRQQQVIKNQAERHGWSSEQANQTYANSRSKTHLGVIERMLSMNNLGQAKVYYHDVKSQLLGDDATRVERALQTGDAVARDGLRNQLRDIEAAARIGIPVTSIPSREELVAAFGESDGERAYNQASGFRQVSRDVARLNTMPAVSIVEAISNYQPTEVEGAYDAAERATIVESSARAIIQAREKDPANYIIQHTPEVAAAWNEAMAGDPEAAARYLQLYQAERGRLQIGNDNLIPEDYADEIAQRITNPATSEELYANVARESGRWGNAWPQVLKQLGPKLPDTTKIIASGISPAAGVALASVSNLKRSELEALVPPGKKWSEIEELVASQMEGTLRSFPPDAGGVRMRGALLDSAMRLTLKYMNDGSSPKAAARLARQALSDQMFTLVDFRSAPFRIPAGLDPEPVEAGARSFIGTFENTEVMRGTQMEDNASISMGTDFIRDHGYWVTKPDGTGLRLYVDGAPVTQAGSLVEYSWMQLSDEGARILHNKKNPRGQFSREQWNKRK